MTTGYLGLRQFEIGKESVAGNAVASTTLLRMESDLKDESKPTFPLEDVGRMGGVGRSFIPKSDGTVPIKDTPATFEQLPYFLNMGVKGVAGVVDGTGSDYIYTYPFTSNAVLTPYTYTARIGDNEQPELMTYLFCEELTIKGEAEKEVSLSGTLRGQIGGPVAFTGGLSLPAVEECLFGLCALYIDAPGGTIGTTQITTGFRGFELKLSKIFMARWEGGGSSVNFNRVVMNSKREISLMLKLDHDTAAVAERAARRAGTARQVRVKCTGSAVQTPGTTYSNKMMIIDMQGSYQEPEPYSDDDGVTSLQFSMKGHYSPTPALDGQVIVVNELAALP